ncbi:MAG TPA: hypothetical protein VNR64_02060 [Vicinamibacterales bacterium]|nr:hypothetical protein [Vicinamibacterales bacterium]
MKRRIVLVAAGLVAVVAALAFVVAGHRTPEGQPALSDLTAATLPSFQQEFNRHADATRVILLLSPT